MPPSQNSSRMVMISFEERKEMLSRELDLIRQELATHKIECTEISQLGRNPDDLERAVPVLVSLLPKIKVRGAQSTIIRAISESNSAAPPLIAEMLRLRPMIVQGVEQAESLGWTVGEAISRTASDRDYDEVVALIADAELGKARAMLPYALARFKKNRRESASVLLKVIEDESMTPTVLDALGRMKAAVAAPVIRRFLDSSNALVKKEAKKALKRVTGSAEEMRAAA